MTRRNEVPGFVAGAWVAPDLPCLVVGRLQFALHWCINGVDDATDAGSRYGVNGFTSIDPLGPKAPIIK